MSGLRLHRARAGDEGRLALLGGATFLSAFAHDHPGDALVAHTETMHSRAFYAAALADPDVALWLLETDLGAPVGYAMMTPPALDMPVALDDLELKRIYLLDRWRGGGSGWTLLQAVEDEARGRGARRLLLCVYTNNPGAQAFYARHGYVDTGGRQRFLVGPAAFEDQIWSKRLA